MKNKTQVPSFPEPQFIYFDFGNVLCSFSHEQAAQQMAQVANVPYDLVWNVVFGSGNLQIRYEMGDFSTQQFYEAFCSNTNSSPNFDSWVLAGAAMFEPIVSTWAIAASLRKANYRLGILSNTCESHWDYCLQRFLNLAEIFPVQVLSYQVRCMKPLQAIYRFAQEMAGCEAESIFFVDDRPENILMAQQSGFNAVQFSSVHQLLRDFHNAQVRFNF
jgi:glucose-1-phosphatase